MKTTVTHEGHTTWHFSKAELVALLAHMGADESRMSICGLVLDVLMGAALVTDGHRGAKVWGRKIDYDRAIGKGPFFVPRPLVESVVKIAKRDAPIEITVDAAGPVVCCTVGQMITGRLLDLTPAPIDQVMPKHDPTGYVGVVAGINPQYLADLALVSSACPPTVKALPRGKKEKVYDGLSLFPPKASLDPWLARISCKVNATEWAVCIMPMRL